MFVKKNVVAVAALLALAAGAAQAQVKVYGYLEGTFGSYEGFSFAGTAATTDRTTQVSSGNMMTSFIGFSGSEDLGGGLKAEFVLESFIGLDEGNTITNLANPSSGFWGRGSWVGLSGDFGRIALGQYDNAFFTMGLSYNPFGSSMVFSPTMVSYYSFAGFSRPSLGYDTGWVNSITYETPNFGGLTASLQYAPKENGSNSDDVKDNFAISAAYNAGPLSLMGVYTTSGANDSAYFSRQKNAGFGVSYDFGAAKVLGQYSQIKDETAGGDGKSKFFQIGATVPVTASGNVLISYAQTKYEDGFLGFADDAKLKQFSLGYDHSISKRTGAYVAFTNQKVDGFTGDDSANVFAVGVRHSF